MRIHYIGDSAPHSNSFHRSEALRRIGHEVLTFDPTKKLKKSKLHYIFNKLHYHTGYRFIQRSIVRQLQLAFNSGLQPDLVWVNGGELLGPDCIRELTKLGCPSVLYNNDDPTGGRDGRRFDTLLKSLPEYQLCAVLREVNVDEYRSLGAKRVIRVKMSYDEVQHEPLADSSLIRNELRSEVAFIGTWMRHEARDAFLCALIDGGIPVSIWGARWNMSPLWSRLQPFYRGAAITGRAYAAAIQGSKICLGLLSKGNRDLHTRRSVEVPFAGGLLCAERTSEHMSMYKEGEEAVFWEDADECIRQCRTLLNDPLRANSIRTAGMLRVRQLKLGNEDICRLLVETARAIER